MSALLDDASTPPRPHPLTEQEIVDRKKQLLVVLLAAMILSAWSRYCADRADRAARDRRRFVFFLSTVTGVIVSVFLSANVGSFSSDPRALAVLFFNGVFWGVLCSLAYRRWRP